MMNYIIRPYKLTDFEEINNWWKSNFSIVLPLDILVEDGSFIMELEGVPALCLTVLKTQTKELSFLENYIKNPKFKKSSLEQHGKILWDHCFQYAKDSGYKRIICMAELDKLKSKYERFGMIRTSNSISTFYKEL